MNLYHSKSQKGVVLFIAMVALVVMSLAAVALIRSVDTNNLIAGNLSYKQTAAISSSYGFESMADTIGPLAPTYGLSNDAANGYYAVCTTFDGSGSGCAGANLTSDASWVPGSKSRYANGLGITSGLDAYGNTIQYIVERMCSSTGAVSSSNCLLAIINTDNSSHNGLNEPLAGAPEILTSSPVYRVTVRITGPKNTISYIQAFLS